MDAFAVSANLVVKFGASSSGRHGVGATAAMEVGISPSNAVAYLANVEDAEGNQSYLRVSDASRFVVGKQIEVNAEWDNHVSVEIMAKNGNTLTVRPKITTARYPDEIVYAISSRGIAFGTNGRMGYIRKPLKINFGATSLYLPFQPNLTAKVVISASAVGRVVIAPRTGYSYTPPIRILSFIDGLVPPRIIGNGVAKVPINMYGSGATDPIKGALVASFNVTANISAIGYTVVTSLNKSIEISAEGEAGQEGTMGIGSAAFGFGIEATAQHIQVTSLYSSPKFRSVSFGVSGIQEGIGNTVVRPLSSIKGHVFDTTKPLGYMVSSFTMTPLIEGRSPSSGIIDKAKIVFNSSTSRARSYVAEGIPVPNGFRHGRMVSKIPAKAVLNITGTTGSVVVSFPFENAFFESGTLEGTSTQIANTLAQRLRDFLNPRTATDPYSVTVVGSIVTITAATSEGSTPNYEPTTGSGLALYGNSTGNRLINGTSNAFVAFSGGSNGNIIITPHVQAKQYEDNASIGFGSTTFAPTLKGEGFIRTYAGTLDKQINITMRGYDTLAGITVPKINTYAVRAAPVDNITVPKIGVSTVNILQPSSIHVPKAAAYAVIFPAGVQNDEYQGMFFF